MKAFGMFMMLAAGATLYVHIRHPQPRGVPAPMVEETPTATPSGNIVVVPHDGTLEHRWQGRRP